ncbi:Rrf2 family transcriptional regulator [Nitrospirillum iridis]|uniref:Rrf2 family nitric oxide-sensitive transcriptional repressor n=1 Tax=Nitrospirillum iridis TaxID=765888 RepID=A0A7X0B3L6_9PROT|nr:Rrf2 family transcriptional regulator [Nitrospirillum iridis]MBB6255108.1 Rrf2 family nitric oxide-sensitive transcriptional repressor [Nitrospirillum iridis]
MRLSSYTDYALRTLVFLALKSDGLATISDIAQTYGISKNHLMKVAHQLSQLGYVEAVRGRGGGLRLGRRAEDIRIGDVVRATEQELDILECFSDSSTAFCRLNPTCVLKYALKEALGAFLAVLDDYTLADLVKPRRTLAGLLDLSPPPAAGSA